MRFDIIMKTMDAAHSPVTRAVPMPGHPALAVISGAALVLFCGCSSKQPIGVTQPRAPGLLGPVLLGPGSVGLVSAGEPARFSFDAPDGRTQYAGDGAANAAVACLSPPNGPDAGLDALYSPLGLVLAPFGAAYGALASKHDKMTAQQLAESQADLARSMAAMAEQRQLSKPLIEAAAALSHRRLVPVDSPHQPDENGEPMGAVLETKVEELRLERLAATDTSYSLLIKARARLHEPSDGKVLYDLPLEYRSGSALFLDWTYPDSFRVVAETGYCELAKHIAQRLLSPAPEGPVLVGAGYKRPQNRVPVAQTSFANYREVPSPTLTRVNYPESDSGPLQVYPAPTRTHVTIQKPLTKDEAVSEAMEEVNWSLDGLQNSRNLVVQLSACGVAVPLSLWKQTVGLVKGVPANKLRSAETRLATASDGVQPQLELAQQVALELTPLKFQPVVLVKNPGPAAVERGSGVAASTLARPNATTALEIHVRSAALTGTGSVNPPLAFCLEAEATLFRVSDGAQLFSCPVHYRSEPRKFTSWAANNAQLFRQELQRSYRQVSATIIKQLVAQGLITPERPPQPTLAED